MPQKNQTQRLQTCQVTAEITVELASAPKKKHKEDAEQTLYIDRI
jgi:hypothetical protein